MWSSRQVHAFHSHACVHDDRYELPGQLKFLARTVDELVSFLMMDRDLGSGWREAGETPALSVT